MKQVVLQNDQVVIADVPAPRVEPGSVLIRVAVSCISVGTETAQISASAGSLLQRAMKQPQKVGQLMTILRDEGLDSAMDVLKSKSLTLSSIGYSCAGIVIGVGEAVDDIQMGDRVACGGSAASHAEIVNVHRQLVVKVPDDVSFESAATTTMGAIALQGVRRAAPTLGETFVVVGLGLLGLLTAQLLRANGCAVIGTDVDSSRVEFAHKHGLDAGFVAGSGGIDTVLRHTDGYGADGVIITAATSSDQVVSDAFQMCRKKGRVVLVGDVGLNLKRSDFYQKEIDFLISSSYGPGRYDANYEVKGLDYPIGYVRWTENRNMQAYLRLIAQGKINPAPFLGEVYDFHNASRAFSAFRDTAARPLTILLSYPVDTHATPSPMAPAVISPAAPSTGKSTIGVALIGAGSFAKSVHLPNLSRLPEFYSLKAVMSRDGVHAQELCRRFGGGYATTDYQKILDDPAIDMVLISTRHHLHVDLALSALEAGKHVLVEKPLATRRADLKRIADFYESRDGAAPPVLLTGFNRRFSPYARKIQEMIRNRKSPLVINYVMNAGYLPRDHWVHSEEGGGRNIGEACHIYDLFTFFTGSPVADVTAQAMAPTHDYYRRNDNFTATVRFEDGSIATLTYTAQGSSAYPKERMVLFSEGQVFFLDDYRLLTLGKSNKIVVRSRKSDKGHSEELAAFARALRDGGEWPLPLWQQIQATEISFQVEDLIAKS